MLSTLVLTIIGPDRPGLVELIATRVAANGGNWLESRMCRLGGQFTGIIRIELPTEKSRVIADALHSLDRDGLRIQIQDDPHAPQSTEGQLATIELVGNDRPGILQQISGVLAGHRVNVEELSSERVNAPIDGSMLFVARFTVLVPTDLNLAVLRSALEQIALDLMVDVQLQAVTD